MPFSGLPIILVSRCRHVEKDGTFLFYYLHCLPEKSNIQLTGIYFSSRYLLQFCGRRLFCICLLWQLMNVIFNRTGCAGQEVPIREGITARLKNNAVSTLASRYAQESKSTLWFSQELHFFASGISSTQIIQHFVTGILMGMAAPQSSVQCGLWPEFSALLCFETNSSDL